MGPLGLSTYHAKGSLACWIGQLARLELLGTEGIELAFSDETTNEIANVSCEMNLTVEIAHS